jgi:hypothetical protein
VKSPRPSHRFLVQMIFDAEYGCHTLPETSVYIELYVVITQKMATIAITYCSVVQIHKTTFMQLLYYHRNNDRPPVSRTALLIEDFIY